MPRDSLQPSPDPLVLYSFRFRDPVSGKWVRARYVAERSEIAARYHEWEIIGPPETRTKAGVAFSPGKSIIVSMNFRCVFTQPRP